MAIQSVRIGVAERRVRDLNTHFPSLRRRYLNILHRKRLLGFPCDSSCTSNNKNTWVAQSFWQNTAGYGHPQSPWPLDPRKTKRTMSSIVVNIKTQHLCLHSAVPNSLSQNLSDPQIKGFRTFARDDLPFGRHRDPLQLCNSKMTTQLIRATISMRIRSW